MKLEKAIEILSRNVSVGIPLGEIEHLDAVRLGIEALKREEYHRSCFLDQSPNLLPGETK